MKNTSARQENNRISVHDLIIAKQTRKQTQRIYQAEEANEEAGITKLGNVRIIWRLTSKNDPI